MDGWVGGADVLVDGLVDGLWVGEWMLRLWPITGED